MSTSIKIFIVEPIDKNNYKTKIVFADNADDARLAASKAHNATMPPQSVSAYDKPFSLANDSPVYLDENMSICIETHPEIISVIRDHAKIKYNNVVYDLEKNIAEDVISESMI